jgi:hypothetical protein
MSNNLLTPQENLCIDAWFKNGCSDKRSALAAANLTESRLSLFQKPAVRAEIAGRQKFLARSQNISEARVLEEYATLAFNKVGDLFDVQEDGSAVLDFRELTEEQRASIESIKTDKQGSITSVKFYSKLTALDSLGRFLGMGADKQELGMEELMSSLVSARRRIRAVVEIDGDEGTAGNTGECRKVLR